MAHTPGRWRAAGVTVYCECSGPVLLSRLTVADTTCAGSMTREEDEANARLIASAPDLLTGCRLALDYLESDESIQARYLRGILREAMKGVTE